MENCLRVSSRQIRAARALLDWSQEDLAQSSGLSIATIRKLEMGHISPRHSTAHLIRQAIEGAGLEFIQCDGVRRQREDIVFHEGPDSVASLFDDICQTVKKSSGEIVMVSTSESPLFSFGNAYRDRLRRHKNLESELSVKCLLLDCENMFVPTPGFEFRSISKCFVEPIPFCVYGNKHAIIVLGEKTSPKIIAVCSTVGAEAAKRQFYSMWDKAVPMHLASEEQQYKSKRMSYR